MQGLLYKYTLTRHKKGLENVVSGVADQLFQLLWEEPDTLLHYLETLGGNKEATSGFNDVMYQLCTNNVNLKFSMSLKFSSTELYLLLGLCLHLCTCCMMFFLQDCFLLPTERSEAFDLGSSFG